MNKTNRDLTKLIFISPHDEMYNNSGGHPFVSAIKFHNDATAIAIIDLVTDSYIGWYNLDKCALGGVDEEQLIQHGVNWYKSFSDVPFSIYLGKIEFNACSIYYTTNLPKRMIFKNKKRKSAITIRRQYYDKKFSIKSINGVVFHLDYCSQVSRTRKRRRKKNDKTQIKTLNDNDN